MQNNLIHRIVILLAFMIAGVFFVIQVSMGYDLLEAAFTAACIMMAASIVLLIALQCVVKMLFEHLSERTNKVEKDSEEPGANVQIKDEKVL